MDRVVNAITVPRWKITKVQPRLVFGWATVCAVLVGRSDHLLHIYYVSTPLQWIRYCGYSWCRASIGSQKLRPLEQQLAVVCEPTWWALVVTCWALAILHSQLFVFLHQLGRGKVYTYILYSVCVCGCVCVGVWVCVCVCVEKSKGFSGTILKF